TTPMETSSVATIITSAPPAPSTSSSASFSFTATEAGSSFACQLDGSAFAACASPKSYSGLADGSHTFRVRATDPAGNTDPTPASYTWTVDTTPPDTTMPDTTRNATPTPPSAPWPLHTPPPDTTLTPSPTPCRSSSSASFSFTATEAGSTFACRLDASAFAACASPKSYSGLADGSHTFRVRATD